VSRQLESKSACSITLTHTTHLPTYPPTRTPPTRAPDWPAGSRLPTLSPTQETPPRFTEQRQDPAKSAFGRASTARLASGTRGAQEAAEREREQTKTKTLLLCALAARRSFFFLGSHGRSRVPRVSRLTRAPPLLAMPCHAGRRLQRRLHALAGWMRRRMLVVADTEGFVFADAAFFAAPRHAARSQSRAQTGAASRGVICCVGAVRARWAIVVSSFALEGKRCRGWRADR
jgi:hypothetical protein